MISDAAYSFGDQFLNAERDERRFLVNKDPTAVSLNRLHIVYAHSMNKMEAQLG